MRIIKVMAAVEPIAIPAMAPLFSFDGEEIWVEEVMLDEEKDVEAEAANIALEVLLALSMAVVEVWVVRDVLNVVVFVEEEVVVVLRLAEEDLVLEGNVVDAELEFGESVDGDDWNPTLGDIV